MSTDLSRLGQKKTCGFRDGEVGTVKALASPFLFHSHVIAYTEAQWPHEAWTYPGGYDASRSWCRVRHHHWTKEEMWLVGSGSWLAIWVKWGRIGEDRFFWLQNGRNLQDFDLCSAYISRNILLFICILIYIYICIYV